jgi:tetratricopeptide (TPR) repeat protein
MTQWQPWNRAQHPEQLADFVQTGVARLLLPAPLAQRLPAAGDGRSPQERARIIYEVLATAGIQYVHEPATSPKGGQEIRPPDQVLARPKHGTCIDLALLFAGACLDAGLRPFVVVVDSTTGRSSHAVIAVMLDRDWALNSAEESPLGGEVFTAQPHLDSGVSFADALRSTVEGSGPFVAVDVQGLAHDGQAGPTSWSEAVSRGHDVVATTQVPDGAWRWSLGVDVGEARRLRPAFDVPVWLPSDRSVLAEAFADAVRDGSPLSQLKARTGRVPFLPRHELDALLEWADPITGTSDQSDGTERPKVSVRVLTGVGGCGKTHLAAELCRRLSGRGWYTGFAPRHPLPPPDSLRWLARVVSPVLAVVDYADESSAEDLVRLLNELSGREQPTRLLLTARADGPWLSKLADALQRDSIGVRFDLPIPLPRRHERAGMLFARTFERFTVGTSPADIGFAHLPQQTNWTTLDIVIQAWLAATGTGANELPETRQALYDKVLEREFDYWQRALYGERLALVPTARLAKAGAALTLVAPDADDVEDVLERLGPTPDSESSWGQLGQVLAKLLAEPTGGLAVRPDPVGEHLVLRECHDLPDLVNAVLPRPPVPPEESATALRKAEFARHANRVNRGLSQAVEVISRAAQFDRAGAIEVAEECLAVRPDMWPQALDHTLRQGGVFAGALEILAKKPHNPLPLESLAALPLGHGALRGLALAAVNSLRPALPDHPDDTERARLAIWLNNYAVRLGEVGDRAGALAAIDEAVTHYRGLAEANPAAFLPNLATSLNNQANRRSEIGDSLGAMTAFADGWEELSASSQARLRLARVQWLLARSERSADTDEMLVADCLEASRLAEDATEETRLVGPARRTVADTVADLTQRRLDLTDRLSSVLPAWALRRPGDDLVSVCNEWLSATSWARSEQLLTEHLDLFRDPDTRESLRTLHFQLPEARGLTLLERLLDDIDEHGVEPVLAEAHRHFTLIEELTDWLETDTWQKSERFLVDHRHLLSDNDALQALAGFDRSPLIGQHLGLLGLSTSAGIETAYAALADADTAVNLGNELLERLDWPALASLLLASPRLGEQPFAFAYLSFVLDAVRNGQGAEWTPDPEVLEHARRHATPEQRRVAAGRLHRILRDHPGLPASLATLADALASTDKPPSDAPPR